MKPYILKLFLLLFISIITACETQTKKPEQETTLEIDLPPITEQQLTLTEEAERLIELAEDTDTLEAKQIYRAKAARLYIEAGQLQLAKQQRDYFQSLLDNLIAQPTLENVDEPTNEPTDEPTLESNTEAKQVNLQTNNEELKSLEVTIALLSAELAIVDHNLTLAEELISNTNPVTRSQELDYFSASANLDYLSGDYIKAVETRVQLDDYLLDKNDKNRNNQKIWAALSNIDTRQLNNLQSNNTTTNGWIDLANIIRSGQNNISQIEDALLDWGTRHSTHPANINLLSELIGDFRTDDAIKKKIAIILPMDGALSKVTDAIKNGLLSAYYNDKDTGPKPEIVFYDSSNKDTSFYQLYQQAINEGATNIIGPLNKVAINQLLQQRELDIPVLSLNYAESSYNYTDDLYQFGLSPADEARQVAELAIKQNKMQAAVFYPDSAWGKRLQKAFTEHYESLGGQVLTSADYATNTNDYRRPIRSMLNLDQSAIRHRKIENILATETNYEPYRRQDIDMIFLAATHRSARGIMPALKFHHAGNIDVVSTSHVYTGKINAELDRDLDGLMFCDMPWVIDNTSHYSQTFKRNWPQQKSYTRLFALGIDAYNLIYNLDYLEDKNYVFYTGETGNLQLTDTNRITRKLLWAKFIKGTPVPMNPLVEPADDI